jgi:hypothetical protein
MTPKEQFRLQLRLMADAAAALRSDAVDVVVLNDAPPRLRHRAMRDRRLLVERDRRARVDLETRAMLEYLDTAPLREEFARGLRHRLAEGRFGRR